MNCRTAGISKQVKEIFPFAHFTQHLTCDTVVEEQTGIKVIRQVDPQTSVIFAHFHEVALLIHFLILTFPFLTLTGFQDQSVGWQFQYRHCCSNHIKQTLARFVGIHRFRRRIFLNHNPLAVAVNSNVIIWQIGIINSVAFDAFLARPFVEFFDIFAQAVCVIISNLA
ncbi:hypothetical protein D3C75_585330 [compost metagenome]